MSIRNGSLLGVFLCITQVVFAQIGAVEVAWLPLTDAEKQQKAPRVDKAAGAEALFWRVHVWDEVVGNDWQRHYVNYVRIKIFNEEGKKKVSSIEIPFGNQIGITNIEGRTIKPDGTIVPLQKQDIHEKEVIRLGNIRRKVKTFAMPALEPGAIVEYRTREVHFKANVRYLRAEMQREYPIQKMTYYVKPFDRDHVNLRMMLWPFNCKNTPLNLEMNGFSSTSATDLPAFEPEPYMLGEDNIRAWILFLYMENDRRDPAKYWEKRGKDVYNQMKVSLRLNDEIKEAAAKAVEGAQSDEQKVFALIGYLRKNMRKLFDRSVSDSERSSLIKSLPKERERTSAEIFKSKIGMPDEWNTLFAAMAQSVGLEARPALVGDRAGISFHPNLVDTYFLDNVDMAVKLDGKWRIFDAATNRLPANMLSWQEEGTQALVSDPKAPTFVATPFSTPDESVSLRRANFKLSEDGTLEGDVDLYYTGHAAAERRAGKAGEPLEKQKEEVKELETRVHAGSEVTEIQLENVDDTSKALHYKYHVRIPGYAQRTGKRLLFAPLFFQQGATPRFSASERKYPIAFQYAWKEDDEVRIKLPAGFKVDNGENPGDLEFGPPGAYKLAMGVTKDNEFVCGRTLLFGRNGAIMFNREADPSLKNVFDELHRRDSTIISFKQEAQ